MPRGFFMQLWCTLTSHRTMRHAGSQADQFRADVPTAPVAKQREGLSYRPRWRARLAGWRPALLCTAGRYCFWLFCVWMCASAAPGTRALNWQSASGYRSAALPVAGPGKTGFTLLPPSATGIHFTNVLSDLKAAENQIRLNGSGVTAGDIDGDGLVDLYFCGLEGGNVLYRNLGGWKFEDITETAGVACPGQYSTGAAFVDVDGDGDLDLLVNALGGGTRLFLNDGKGRFREAVDSGLVPQFGAMSLALADIDGDGDLDLYVANYRTTTIRSTGLDLLNINGRRMIRPQDRDQYELTPEGTVRERGEADILYRNDGKGHFLPVSWTGGAFLDEAGRPLKDAPREWGQSAMFRDLNGDGAPDLYVCNDFWDPDRAWWNDGSGRFRALGLNALPDTSTFSMGVDVADINRDGFDDLIVLDMLSPGHQRRMTAFSPDDRSGNSTIVENERPQVARNTFFLNRGDGTYAEIAQFSRVDASDWSWCPMFLDVDLDGYEDLLVSAGNRFDTQDLDAETRIRSMGPWPREKVPSKLLLYPPLPLPKKAFHNEGNLRFREVGQDWGFDAPGVSHGMCLADLDNDGDLDVVVNSLNGAAGIYRNESGAPRVAVRLKGSGANSRGIGAKVFLYGGAVPAQSQEMICGGRYLSSDDPMRVFAAGSVTNEMRIEVRWRSGKRSVVNGVKANRIYEVEEAGAEESSKLKAQGSREGPTTKDQQGTLNIEHPTLNVEQPTSNIQQSATKSPEPGTRAPDPIPNPQPMFEDVSGLIGHRHHDEAFDDFQRQPLLPRKLSRLGPGVGWLDLDGDGFEDLVIGAGRGGRLAAFRNNAKGGFESWPGAPFDTPVTRDQTGIVGWQNALGATLLLVGSANYEDGLAAGSCVRQYRVGGKTVDDTLAAEASSTGPLAIADWNGDGRMCLFVGGRVVPGRYPEAASSRMFYWVNGKWETDAENSKRLTAIGLVSGAVFSDLDGDGRPELILACEWGPIRILRNDRGGLVAWDPPVTLNNQPSTLSQLSGWWNSVTTVDLDGDGKPDIIAGNWGRNTRFESHRVEALRLYYGEFNRDGVVSPLQAYYDGDLKKVVPEEGMDFLAAAMPFLRERFSSYRAYAQAGVQEILGERMAEAKELQAATLDSMIFLNRGDHLEAMPLPMEAQWAPAFGICVGDFDGDGKEDVFLSQNFIGEMPGAGRNDAGRGLWLRGDGKGNLAPVAGQESGVRVYGEQRGAALCDYDGDGRVDLVVTQNGAETKLYHNRGGKPGLRVRLQGPAGNPQGIGAQMRLSFGTGQGPIREIHAGSGYWSQDSAVQVLAAPLPPVSITVRWPGGKITGAPLPPGAKEISVDPGGDLKVLK